MLVMGPAHQGRDPLYRLPGLGLLLLKPAIHLVVAMPRDKSQPPRPAPGETEALPSLGNVHDAQKPRAPKPVATVRILQHLSLIHI